MSSAQSPCQNESFVYTSRKLLKNRNSTFPAVRYFTRKLELVPNILSAIVGCYPGETSLLKKEFKIWGIIDNSWKKDPIIFVSLRHQINDGRTAGYSENAIAGGVLKKMSTNLRLRNVLETVEGLSFDSLLRFYKILRRRRWHRFIQPINVNGSALWWNDIHVLLFFKKHFFAWASIFLT